MALGSLGSVFYDIVANDMTGAGITSSRAGLMTLGAAFTGVGMAAAGMTNDIQTSFSSFEGAMTEVRALGGVTTEEFELMRDAALDLSKQFPITATDIANGMYQMVSVGYDYQQMMETMPEAAALATAGSITMAESVDAIIKVMGAYGEETYEVTEITKVFANAVGVGAYEMGDFMTEMMKNIGVATQLGISLSDLASYNVALQMHFTTAEEAGTSFSRMLVQITNPNTVKMLADMGIAITDSEGHFRDLADIMSELKLAMSGVTDDGERLALLQDLFGTYGYKAADALMKESENMPELRKNMEELNLIQDQTNVKLAGYNQQLEIANNKMEAAKIAMGEGMAPATILVADAMSSLAAILEGLPGPLQSVGGTAIYAAQGLSALGPVLMGIAGLKMLGLGGIFTSISGGLQGLVAGMASELSAAGFGLAGTLIAGIAGGLALGLAGVWVLLKTGVLDAISDIGRTIESSPLGSVIMDAMKVILAPIGSIGSAIIALVQGDFARIPEVMVQPFQQAGEAIGRLGSSVVGLVNSFSGIGAIAGYAGSAFAGIGGAFNAMAGQVQGVFSQMFGAIRGMIASVAGGFYAAGANIITSMVNGIVAAAGGIVTAIANALNQVRALFPFSPAKEGPLAETPNWGTWMSAGMQAAGPEVAAAASANLAAPAAAGVAGGMAAGGASGGGGDTITIAAGAIVIQGAGKNAGAVADEVLAAIAMKKSELRKQRGMRS